MIFSWLAAVAVFVVDLLEHLKMKFYLLFHTNSLLQDFETIYVDELKLI